MTPEHMMTQPHEDPIESASQKAASHITVALAIAQRYIDARRRRLDGTEPDTDPAGTDPRQVYAVMLGRDKGTHATSQQALAAWAAAQPLRDQDPDADLATTRAEDRLRTLHPDAMDRYDALRHGLDPEAAMREIAPLIAADTYTRDNDAQLQEVGQQDFDDEDLTGPQYSDLYDPVASHAAAIAAYEQRDRAEEIVHSALGTELADAVLDDPRWTELADTLHAAELIGHDPVQVLRDAALEREMATAKYPAQVLTSRLTATGHTRPPANDATTSDSATQARAATTNQPASDPTTTALATIAAAEIITAESITAEGITAEPTHHRTAATDASAQTPAAQTTAAAPTRLGVASASFPVPITAIPLTEPAPQPAPSVATTTLAAQLTADASTLDASTANEGTSSEQATTPTAAAGTTGTTSAASTGSAGAASFPTALTEIPLTQALAAGTAAETATVQDPAATTTRQPATTTGR